MKSQIICSHILCQPVDIHQSEDLEKLDEASAQRAPDISVINLECEAEAEHCCILFYVHLAGMSVCESVIFY